MECHAAAINAVLGTPDNHIDEYKNWMVKTLDMLKEWLASLISHESEPSCMAEGAKIEKKDLRIAMRSWFGFISNNVMMSQNDYILMHRRLF